MMSGGRAVHGDVRGGEHVRVRGGGPAPRARHAAPDRRHPATGAPDGPRRGRRRRPARLRRRVACSATALAPALPWLLRARGITDLRLDLPPPWIAWAVAVPCAAGVALIGSWRASKRAAKVPPVAALQEAAIERRRPGFWQALIGIVCLAAVVAVFVCPRRDEPAVRAGLPRSCCRRWPWSAWSASAGCCSRCWPAGWPRRSPAATSPRTSRASTSARRRGYRPRWPLRSWRSRRSPAR